MGNLNCKSCQCNKQPEAQMEFLHQEALLNIMEGIDEEPLSLEEKRDLLIKDAKKSLQGNIHLIFNYKSEASWDLPFCTEDNKQANLNGLLSLKKKINEFYDNFLTWNGIPEQLTYNKDNIENINDTNEFINRFKPVILKNMLGYFKIHGLEKKLKNSNIILTNIETIEIYNQLFRSDSFISQVPIKNNEQRKSSLFDIKTLEVINEKNKIDKRERRTSLIHTKADTRDSSHSKGNLLTSVTDFLKGLAMSRKNSSIEHIVTGDEKNEIEKVVEDKRESFCSIFQMSNENMKFNRLIIKGKDTYELNKILDIFQKEEDHLIFVSFKDKVNNTFYEGYWHIVKHTKYGLGIEYHFDSNNKYKYFGYFKDDNYHGLGILLKESYSYFGEFRNGKYAGYGFEKGKVFSYQGFFKDNKYCGFGEYNYMKSSYIGCYRNSLKETLGLAKFDDGCMYLGMYLNNLMNGVGLYKWPEGHSYYGEWKEDKKCGIGYHNWSSGHSYIGGYKNDLKDGNGEYSFNNGSKLRGIWVNGKKENIFELVDSFKSYQIAYRNDMQVE
jgi:hypothetical protein